MDDKTLAARAANGDETAFEEIIRRYGGLIKAIAAFHLKEAPAWREDCVNDILFAIWQNMDRFDADKSTLKNWIGAVAKYRCINWKKKLYKSLTAKELTEDITDGKEIDETLLLREIHEEAVSLLSGLCETDRKIFIKRYLLDKTVEEIAADDGKKPSWVYNRLSRGRNKLRRIHGGKRSDYREKRI